MILTEWNLFRALELRRLKALLSQPLIIDLRNVYQPAKMAAAGFRYISVGRREGVPEGKPAVATAGREKPGKHRDREEST